MSAAEVFAEVAAAVRGDDPERVRALAGRLPADDAGLLDRCLPDGLPPLLAARSLAMIDALVGLGAQPQAAGVWWAAGFHLDRVAPEVAAELVRRGAALTPHAAAGLGLVSHLERLLDSDPPSVRAPGGDGATPLHFARNPEMAALLLGRGALIDARDLDHDSTPAQWRIGDAPAVTHFLLERGAQPDLFMAAAFGDEKLARRLIEQAPECTGWRIGDDRGPFPGIGFGGRGGTIYQWSLGFNTSPQEIAERRGHHALYQLLMAKTPPRAALLVACMRADRALAFRLAGDHPGLVAQLAPEEQALLAKSCWETNRRIDAVRLILDLGFPVGVPERNHGWSALHNAAWCGDPELVALLLDRGHPVDQRDPRFGATALGFAVHSCVEAKRHPEGDFVRVVELLLEHGVPFDAALYPTGDPGLDSVLAARRDSAAPGSARG